MAEVIKTAPPGFTPKYQAWILLLLVSAAMIERGRGIALLDVNMSDVGMVAAASAKLQFKLSDIGGVWGGYKVIHPRHLHIFTGMVKLLFTMLLHHIITLLHHVIAKWFQNHAHLDRKVCGEKKSRKAVTKPNYITSLHHVITSLHHVVTSRHYIMLLHHIIT